MRLERAHARVLLLVAWSVACGGQAARSAKSRLIFLAALTVLLAGCGVSLKNTSQAPSTYNVTVTASGTSAPTHTQQFVLTITQ